MTRKSYRKAINEAMHAEMARDKSVVLVGVDVASGRSSAPPEAFDENRSADGVLGVTSGLFERFGRERVIETPITESAVIGMCVGAASTGLRPIADLMFVDFIGVCFDQIFNQAAKLRYMFGGKVQVPLVVRASIGAGMGAAAQHSQMLHSILTHIPGLKVVIPSNAYDAKGLLIEAIRDNDPVFFLEHKGLYDEEDDVPDESYTVPFGEVQFVSEGDDITIVAFSKMVTVAHRVVSKLQTENVAIDLIDPRTTSPLDLDSIIESLERTGKLLIVDEGYPRCGIASDIAGMIASQAFDKLKAPIELVTPPHTPVPFSPALERAYVPDEQRIEDAARRLLER